tara:strand:- start:376 stop:588 length:213 start_codon:yes stop_codon:yes gene_type:complete
MVVLHNHNARLVDYALGNNYLYSFVVKQKISISSQKKRLQSFQLLFLDNDDANFGYFFLKTSSFTKDFIN